MNIVIKFVQEHWIAMTAFIGGSVLTGCVTYVQVKKNDFHNKKLETDFYQYDTSTGRVIKHEKEDLIRKWPLTSTVELSIAQSITPGFDRVRQTTSSATGRSRLPEEGSRLGL